MVGDIITKMMVSAFMCPRKLHEYHLVRFNSMPFLSLSLSLPLAHHSSIRRRHLHCHRTQNTQRVERICAFNLCVNVYVFVCNLLLCVEAVIRSRMNSV